MKIEKLTNVGKFDNIFDYVNYKIEAYSGEKKTFLAMFSYMFSEKDNVFCELSDGYRIKRITYGEQKERVRKRASALKDALDLPAGSMVGIYASNSPEWIEVFWAILMCGYNPLLINMRLQDDVVEKILTDYSVKAVVSDGKKFSAKTLVISEIGYGEAGSFDCWGDKVVFMSSGTTDNVKLCVYTAENFYYQLLNSVDIVKRCPSIASHYEGELKHLTILPFYHVFGFIAVYMWFGFFSRTFVFLKDMNPQTILGTVKKHKVTHIFAVPLLWETVYKSAKRKIAERGEKTYKKFEKGLKLASSGKIGQAMTRKAMAEIRENLVGDSVRFMISGGSPISSEALEFINGIGYCIANGYGMTEVGITSVETSTVGKERNLGSVGAPFAQTEYKIDSDGRLLIRGKNMASVIMQGGESKAVSGDEWFNSGDLARLDGERYYVHGRADDLIVSHSGENLNPVLIEQGLKISGADAVCLISLDDKPTLVVSAKACYSEQKAQRIIDGAKKSLASVGLGGEIHDVILTPDPLMEGNEFKISRKKVAKRLKENRLTVIEEGAVCQKISQLLSGLEQEVACAFAEALRKSPQDINADDDFFTDLGGTSLDYFVLSDAIKNKFGVDVKNVGEKSLTTVKTVCQLIKND